MITIGVSRIGQLCYYSRLNDGVSEVDCLPVPRERAQEVVEANPDADTIGVVDFSGDSCTWHWTANIIDNEVTV